MIRGAVSGSEALQGVARVTTRAVTDAYHKLVDQGFLRKEELMTAKGEAVRRTVDLATVLMDRYRIPKPAIGAVLTEFYGCPFQPYDERIVIDRGLVKNLNVDYLRLNHWVPLARHGSVVEILIDDPHNSEKVLDVRRAFPGAVLSYRVGLPRDIERFLLMGQARQPDDLITDILGELVSEAQIEDQQNATIAAITENDSAIVRLANQVIAEPIDRELLIFISSLLRPKGNIGTFSGGWHVLYLHEDSGGVSSGDRVSHQDYGEPGHCGATQATGRQDSIQTDDGARDRVASGDAADSWVQ